MKSRGVSGGSVAGGGGGSARRAVRGAGALGRRGPPRPPDAVRVVLFVSIVGAMLFALYTLFLWPTLSSAMHPHQHDEYIIEEEVAEEHSLKVAPLSHLRRADLAAEGGHVSGGGGRRRPGGNNVVAGKIQEQHAIGSGVAAEYNVPAFPVVPADANYPVRSPAKGTIVYGRPGTKWVAGEPTRGLRDIDAAHMHGQNNVREDGSPGWVPLPDLDWSKETEAEKRQRHDHTCFNVRHSDSIPLDREVPDARAAQCLREGTYMSDHTGLPTTSVVFVFYNEPISPLLRSVHSVLNRSPPDLLKEIILIDDGSTAEWTGEELASYIKLLPKTILKRTAHNGLMVARTEGALLATADTVTFLDSHIEVNHGWLEPLLARIAQDRRHVVMPIIDGIDADSLQYRRGGIDILGFSWTLGQAPLPRPRTAVEPMPSPIMAGGLFSIDRLLFYELGTYDQEMRLYGGEEMEISFRIWQCGFTLECIPCSRVGHIFRSGRYFSGQVFDVPGHEITRNKLRAAHAWMGPEYTKIVELASAVLPEDNPVGDLSNMEEIKERLQCKDFDWYLHNVYPEQKVPSSHAIASGALYNPKLFACLDSLSQTTRGSEIGAYMCHWSHGTQAVIFNEMRQIGIASTSFKLCLSSEAGGGSSDKLVMNPCQVVPEQQFDFDKNTGHLKLGARCVQVERDTSPRGKVSPFRMFLAQCSFDQPLQEWRFRE